MRKWLVFDSLEGVLWLAEPSVTLGRGASRSARLMLCRLAELPASGFQEVSRLMKLLPDRLRLV